MKRQIYFLTLFFVFAVVGPSLAETPHQVGPFILNHDIDEFSGYLRKETALSIRHRESIKEIEIKPIKGFKSGLIEYGTCAAQDRVIRIKLKYADPSKAFYETLKKKIEARFGKSDEYQGDPFHIVIRWKWSFVDDSKNRISLVLQHNTRDEEEKMGNSIKLTLSNLLESEMACHRQTEQAEREKMKTREGEIVIPGRSGWDLYMPR